MFFVLFSPELRVILLSHSSMASPVLVNPTQDRAQCYVLSLLPQTGIFKKLIITVNCFLNTLTLQGETCLPGWEWSQLEMSGGYSTKLLPLVCQETHQSLGAWGG